MTNFKFIALISLAMIASQPSFAEQVNTEWRESEYGFLFSIRCSKGPRKTTFAQNEAHWFDQIYLRWDGQSFNRLAYSTTINAPHEWYGGESGYTFTSKESGGDSVITLKSQERVFEGKTLRIIDINLDATGEGELGYFLEGFFTHGSWHIKMKDGVATLEEQKSTFNKGKLTDASSSSWANCRIMDAYGNSANY